MLQPHSLTNSPSGVGDFCARLRRFATATGCHGEFVRGSRVGAVLICAVTLSVLWDISVAPCVGCDLITDSDRVVLGLR